VRRLESYAAVAIVVIVAHASPADADDKQQALDRADYDAPITEADVYSGMDEAFAAILIFKWAVILPHAGFTLRDGSPGFVLSWPGSLPFGPVTASSQGSRTSDVAVHQPLRVVLEPGLVLANHVSLFVRPALRYLWHPSTSSFGLGVGLGSSLEWTEMDRFSLSVSPELLLHYGACCRPGYLLLALRLDEFIPRREVTAFTANVGLTFW